MLADAPAQHQGYDAHARLRLPRPWRNSILGRPPAVADWDKAPRALSGLRSSWRVHDSFGGDGQDAAGQGGGEPLSSAWFFNGVQLCQDFRSWKAPAIH
jgi:hypothetical protein